AGLSAVDMRNRLDEFPSILVPWIFEQRPALAGFDNAAIAQNDGPITHHPHHIEIVADEQQREVILAPQPVQELQYDRLYGNIERRRRLIQHQKPWLARDGTRDADAGFLAAGELMRKA